MNKDKELELRKAVGDKAYYKKKLEDDRMTLKLLRILAVILLVTSVVIIAVSIIVEQYYFTLGWSLFAVFFAIIGYVWWNKIAKRRNEYLEAYKLNEIQKNKPVKENYSKDTKVIKPKKR